MNKRNKKKLNLKNLNKWKKKKCKNSLKCLNNYNFKTIKVNNKIIKKKIQINKEIKYLNVQMYNLKPLNKQNKLKNSSKRKKMIRDYILIKNIGYLKILKQII